MSGFDSVTLRRDARLIRRHGVTLRITRDGGAMQPVKGIIDLAAEFYGDNDDVPYLGKALTVLVSDLPTHKAGDTLQRIDAAGNPVGPVYTLQRPLRNDGHIKAIEIT